MSLQVRRQLFGSGLAIFVLLLAIALFWKVGTGSAQTPPQAAAPAAEAAKPVAKADKPAPEPQGRSVLDTPETFDRAAFAANPKAFTEKLDGSRIYQQAPLPTGQEKWPELLYKSPSRITVLANQKVPQPLAVQAKPGTPVTFAATESGQFANKQNVITVLADDKGIAKADFWVFGEGPYRVWAGAPENDGPLLFDIDAQSAETRKYVESAEYAAEVAEGQARMLGTAAAQKKALGTRAGKK